MDKNFIPIYLPLLAPLSFHGLKFFGASRGGPMRLNFQLDPPLG